MARMTIAAIAAVLLLACGAHQAAAGRDLKTICTPKCPSKLYEVFYTDKTSCGYICLKPVLMACPKGPARDPLYCGGTTGKFCPSIACTTASTNATSGPGGCASAQASIAALAVSPTMVKTAMQTVLSPPIAYYCAGDATVPPAVAARDASAAYAKVIAQTYVDYYNYVCSCCLGNSQAYSVVQADVQAVANATASAVAVLSSAIECLGEYYVALLSAKADALANDVQVAIDSVLKQYVSDTTNNNLCKPFDVRTRVETAIARATVCTFVEIFGAVILTHDPMDPLVVDYSCSDSISIAGGDSWTHGEKTCKYSLDCPL